MQKITPFLWFNNNAEEAIHFYTSVFKEAKPGKMARYGDAGPGPKGQVLTATLELFGQQFIFLNGGPHFNFTEAVSFVVNCESQEEIDYYWERLTAGGGKESMCGWLKDKFGLSWQIVPRTMGDYFAGSDAAASDRAMRAMMQMRKIDISKLETAYNNAEESVAE